MRTGYTTLEVQISAFPTVGAKPGIHRTADKAEI